MSEEREALIREVHKVFTYGLDLRERLERGETPSIDREQATFKGLLNGGPAVQGNTDYFGDKQDRPMSFTAGGGSSMMYKTSTGEGFMGVRYALACWVDELLIMQTHNPEWGEEWRDKAMEVALFGFALRYDKFWEQALFARRRPNIEVLEVFFWCVVLGFKGKYGDDPEKMQTWIQDTRQRLLQAQSGSFPYPPEKVPPATMVPVLKSVRSWQTVIKIATGLLLLLVPLIAFALVFQFGGSR
jgi:type VI secretion system protein ImpK